MILSHDKVEQEGGFGRPDGMREAGLELDLGKYCCLKSETRCSPCGGRRIQSRARAFRRAGGSP